MTRPRRNLSGIDRYTQIVLPTLDTLLCRGTSLFLPPENPRACLLVTIPRAYKRIIDERRFAQVLGHRPEIERLWTQQIQEFNAFVLHLHLRYDAIVAVDPRVDVCFLDVAESDLVAMVQSAEEQLRVMFGDDPRLNARDSAASLRVVATLREAQAELELNGYVFETPRLGELSARIANDYQVKVDSLSDPDAFAALSAAIQEQRTVTPGEFGADVQISHFLEVDDYIRIVGSDPIPNQFLTLMDLEEGRADPTDRVRAFRMHYDAARFVPVDLEAIRKEVEPIWSPAHPFDLQQLLALDILLDDDIELAFVIGPRQCGKTILALVGAQTRVFGRGLTRRKKLPMEKQIRLIKSGLPDGIRQDDLLGEYAHFKSAFGELSIGVVPFEEMLKPFMDRRQKSSISGGEDWRDVLTRTITLPDKAPFDLVSPERIHSMTFTGYTIRDECQNEYPHVMDAFVGRKGPGAKIIVLGDLCDQISRPGLDEHWNGLLLSLSRFRKHPKVAVVKLTRTWSGMGVAG
ncbi:MAG: hypothetical protein ABIJ09_12705 [Pseudomonadota bacterium]